MVLMASWRASFVLAAMGGAVGLGNLLRFPGQVFANNGLQWFIPYLIALVFLGIPVFLLEISIGQAYRGGCAISYDHINKCTKGVGLSVVFNGYAVVVYYVPILAWIMREFAVPSRALYRGRIEARTSTIAMLSLMSTQSRALSQAQVVLHRMPPIPVLA